MNRKLIVSCLLLSLLVIAPSVSASILDWKTYQTKHFCIFYPTGSQYQAKKTSYYLEKYRSQILDLTGNKRDIKAHVVVQDTGVAPNGIANNIAAKISVFTPHPPTGSLLASTQSWLRLVSVHEFTHVAQLNNYSSTAAPAAEILGKTFSPNMYSPLWVIEGITVYSESQLNEHSGRLNGGYYDAVVASKAQVGKLPSILEANYIHNSYPAGQYYTYGGVFFRYLARQYGKEKLAEYFRLYGSYSWAPAWGSLFPGIGIDLAAIEVFGKSFPTLFAEWKAAERHQHQTWSPGGNLISKTNRGKISNLTAAEGKLYYIRQDKIASGPFNYYSVEKLMVFNPVTGRERKLTTLPGHHYSDLKRVGDKLYYVLYGLKSGYPNIYRSGQGVVGKLYSYQLATGQQQKLFTAELNAFSVIGEKEVIYTTDRRGNFGSQIWRYQKGAKQKIAVVDQLIGELTRYQGKFIAVSKQELGSWNLNYLTLPEADLSPLVATAWLEKQAKIKQDKIYFTANYGSESAVYCYRPQLDKVVKVSRGDYAAGGVSCREQFYFVSLTPTGEGLYTSQLAPKDYSLPPAEEVKNKLPDFSAQTVDAKPALRENLSYLLPPDMRITPYLASGSDALGLNHYWITFASANRGLNFKFTSQMLSPCRISFASTAEQTGRQNRLTLSYPVYRARTAGLTEVKLKYQTDFSASRPGVKAVLWYPRHRSLMQIRGNLATGGFTSRIGYRHLLNSGRIKLGGKVVKETAVSVPPHSFAVTQEKTSGYQLSCEYTRSLLELRKGLWNPNIFFGDLYGTAFINHTNFDSMLTAYGGELSLETGVLFRTNLVPTLGVSICQKTVHSYFRIKSAF